MNQKVNVDSKDEFLKKMAAYATLFNSYNYSILFEMKTLLQLQNIQNSKEKSNEKFAEKSTEKHTELNNFVDQIERIVASTDILLVKTFPAFTLEPQFINCNLSDSDYNWEKENEIKSESDTDSDPEGGDIAWSKRPLPMPFSPQAQQKQPHPPKQPFAFAQKLNEKK